MGLSAPRHYGLLWWNNADGSLDHVPRDAYWSWGLYDSLILVVPSLDIVVARAGKSFARKPGGAHYDPLRPFFDPIIAAVTDHHSGTSQRTSPSRAIMGIRWGPASSIGRAARGSDNWPMTWADDDSLYGAYGDGNGFEPFVPAKLSLGFARIGAGPADLRGENLPAPTLEQTGDGPTGRKASGLLSVRGVLYLLARNAGNAQLASSSDHGHTWKWADWKFTHSFGCPTFVNYGRNYDGNLDGFVYVLSPDGDSAYKVADRFVLARVPIDFIGERNKYEFFAGANATGAPSWTVDAGQCGAILERPGACYRPSVTFDAGLGRFLLVHTHPNERSRDADGRIDTRRHGGLSIYEAAHPWGPWTAIFDTDDWDVGPGDSASFPAKWISADGCTLHLVFSGDDAFSVRRAEMVLTEPANRPAK
jgi:hypothetical protein